MTELKKVLESTMKIRFHDCDPFNHLNNSRYLDYIMTARGDQLTDHYNFDIYKLAREQGVGWVIAQTQIAYISPALLMEEVVIETRLLAYSERSLHLEAFMWNKNKSHLKAVLWARFVHYNLRTQKSHSHDESLMNFFSQIVNPLSHETAFEERIKSLKTMPQI
ncbi:MAG: acyl-CoA thioesterase [Cyclobacteriaceae bacterium]|nr:acyl-CoA thioesterase [Cyclobacteriaceae bacterium]